MAKTATITTRIDPKLKAEAESILAQLGVPASGAISMFYRQIVLHRGLPFSVRMQDPPSFTDFSALSAVKQRELLQAGFDDIAAGRTASAKKVFDSLHQEFDY